jgi:hypothetical protein
MKTLAYLDAASGSMIIQAVIGGVAGIAVLFKVGWRRVLALFSPRRRRELKAEQEAREAAAAKAEAEGVTPEVAEPEPVVTSSDS